MKSTEKKFKYIDGVPLYYDRGGSRVHVDFRSTSALYNKLAAWKRDIETLSREAGYGSLGFFVSAGAYVPKSGKHGEGEAFDLDEINWSDGRVTRPIAGDHAHSSAARRKRYLAIDAITRRHFRWVLNGWYDAAHRDHIHFDTSTSVRLSKGSKSDTTFIQAVCNEFGGTRLRVDGDWGSKTQQAFDQLMRSAALRGLNPVGSPSEYRRFLTVVAQAGFANVRIDTLRVAVTPSTPSTPSTPPLQRAGAIPPVRTWQAMLREIGFPISVDGDAGPQTRQAVKWFQEAWTYENLPIDGRMGSKTYAALSRCTANRGNISPHFNMKEMKSKGNGWPRMHRDMTRGLEKVRSLKGRPINLISAHRDPAHNRRIGGASNSQHMYGRAIDVSRRYGLTIAQAKSVGIFTGIGFAPGTNRVVHLDIRPGRSPRNPSVFAD